MGDSLCYTGSAALASFRRDRGCWPVRASSVTVAGKGSCVLGEDAEPGPTLSVSLGQPQELFKGCCHNHTRSLHPCSLSALRGQEEPGGCIAQQSETGLGIEEPGLESGLCPVNSLPQCAWNPATLHHLCGQHPRPGVSKPVLYRAR